MSISYVHVAIYSAAAFVAYTSLRIYGIYLILLLSLVMPLTSGKSGLMSWERYKPFFHAIWALPVLFVLAAFIAVEPLKQHDLIKLSAMSGWIVLPIDDIALSLTSTTQDAANKYPSVYFSGFWKRFLPSSQLGLTLGSAVYGACLAVVADNRTVPHGRVAGAAAWQVMFGVTAFLVAITFAMQLLPILALPGGPGIAGRIIALIFAPFTWALALFASIFIHAIFDSTSKFIQRN